MLHGESLMRLCSQEAGLDESKSSSSIAKPAEFFIGLVDLFSILLPGGIATVGLYGLYLSARPGPDFGILQRGFPEGSYWPFWLALAVASYLLGHFIFLLGSVSLDNLYDAIYRRRKRESDAIQNRARTLLSTVMGLQRDEVDSALQWATTFGRMRVPSAMVEVDRLEADSKFFRSLSVLLVLADAAATFHVASSMLRRMLVLALPLLAFLMTIMMGRWRDREARIRKLAYRLYEKRVQSGEAAADGASEDWSSATGRIELTERITAAILIFAVCGQVVLGIVWTPGPKALLHLVAGALLFLSVWRFMERRIKRTVLTYRLFVASCLPDSGISEP